MRSIALTAVNARYAHTNPALFYLERAISEVAGSDRVGVEILEWHIGQPERGLLERLAAGFDLIAFSVYIWNAPFLRRLLPDLRRIAPDSVIVLGGPEAVHSAGEWLELEGVDYVVDGRAEDAASLLLSLEAAERSRRIKLPPLNRKLPPSPWTGELLESLDGRVVYYEASRGCPFRCAYCLSARDDAGVVFRDSEELEEDLALLAAYRGSVKFVDRSFNALPDISRRVWRFLRDHPPAGRFHFELHPLLLDEEDFRLLETLPAGRIRFEIGIQSTDPEVLAAVDRAGDPEREAAAICRLKAMNRFELHLDQIVGLPGDTPATAGKSIDEILALEPDIFQLGFLKLLPGTPLRDRREELGLVASATPPYELLESPGFAFRELSRFRRIAELIEVLVNRGEFARSLARAAVLAGGHFRLFSELLAAPDVDTGRRRWEYWAGRLITWTERNHPRYAADLRDLLRFDWASRAGAPRYPDVVAGGDEGTLRELRRLNLPPLKERLPRATAGELKRAILFLPETGAGRAAAEGEGRFFLTVGGERVSIALAELKDP